MRLPGLVCFVFLSSSVASAQRADQSDSGEFEPSAYSAAALRAGVPDEQYKPAVQAHFEALARDPTSLIYTWGPPPREGWTDIAFAPRHEGLVGCVWVNGKNGFGGYAGRRGYVYVVARGRVVQTFEGMVKVGKFISHDPGCRR